LLQTGHNPPPNVRRSTERRAGAPVPQTSAIELGSAPAYRRHRRALPPRPARRISSHVGNDFVALDVETANADLSSICQVGLVAFADGRAAGGWTSLVNPDDQFDGMNVALHGIDEAAVRGAPRFPGVAADVARLLAGQIVVSHMPFDRLAIERAHQKYGLAPIACTWLDSARVTRRAWPEFAARGYALESIAEFCGID